MLAASIVLCGFVKVGQPVEFCKSYGEIMAKKVQSVERFDSQKAMLLTEIIIEAIQTDDCGEVSAAINDL